MARHHFINKFTRPKKRRRLLALAGSPQRKGVCSKVYIRSPKKPNSAMRKVCNLSLSSGKRCTAYIPGEGHTLQKYSTVLIRAGRVKDLPGVKYKCIGGKFDFICSSERKQRRSLYGIKR